MYASFNNQSINLIHYLFAIILLFLIFPGIIFKKSHASPMENIISNYFKMVLLLIILGYLLVITKLFEVFSLLTFFLLLFLHKYLSGKKISSLKDMLNAINILIFDITDGIIHPISAINDWFNNKCKKFLYSIANKPNKSLYMGFTLLFLVIIIYSAYLCFTDAFIHAAPAMSDGSTTLAWMKNIDKRILFYEPGGGIYPRGFHIYLDIIDKFAFIDPLYVLKYTGPFNELLIISGLFFVTCRLTKNRFSGIIAAAIYGLLGMQLATEWVRHAATNSQEFAFIFVLPVLYFFYCYIKDSRQEDFWAAVFGTAVTGMVHQFAFAFIAAGAMVLVFTALITDIKVYWNKIFRIFLAGITVAVVSAIPFLYGILFGYSLHSESESFLFSRAQNVIKPALKPLDYTAIGCMILILLYVMFSRKRSKELIAEKFILLLGISVFAVYYLGGVITHSELISTRSGELWALVLPCTIGMGWYVLSNAIPKLFKIWTVEFILGLCMLAFIYFYIKPEPIIPYKMERDDAIEQYLRISSSYQIKNWWLISTSRDMYSIVLGKGFHEYVSNFINTYDPGKKALTEWGKQKPDKTVPPDIFIYHQKHVYRTFFSNLQAVYDSYEKDETDLENWIRTYKLTHKNISVYYEDNDFIIYHIIIPSTIEENLQNIWGR